MKNLNVKALFKPPFFLAICVAFIHLACKMDINQPVEAPNSFWDESLNTHPKGAAFQKLLDDYVKKGLPGVVMFVKSPQGIWNGAAGYAKIETKEPMTPMHLFHSESIAKTNTATAVMMLVDE
ncbi:MAG: serine hydrolase, partial [bacterium]